MQECRDCEHYELYKMITAKQPYGYTGDIPCVRCVRCGRFEKFNDEFAGVTPSSNVELKTTETELVKKEKVPKLYQKADRTR